MTTSRLVSPGRLDERDPALEQAVEAVRNAKRARNVLLDDQDADPAFLDRRNELVEGIDDERRETEADLVAQQELRVGEQRTAKCHHLLLAAGQFARLLPAPLLEHREEAEHILQADLPPPADLPAEMQVLFDGQRRKQPAPLGHERDAHRHDLRRAVACEILAFVADGALDAVGLPDDGLEQRRFAGAVRTDDRNDLAGLDR